METNDKIIERYFAQLPQPKIDPEFADRLVEIGQRAFAERQAVRADRGGIWIAAITTVVLIAAAIGIMQLWGADFAQFWNIFAIDSIDLIPIATFLPWAMVGAVALAMLIVYTLLIGKVERKIESGE